MTDPEAATIKEIRKFQRQVLLRTFAANGLVEPTTFLASKYIDGLIAQIEKLENDKSG